MFLRDFFFFQQFSKLISFRLSETRLEITLISKWPSFTLFMLNDGLIWRTWLLAELWSNLLFLICRNYVHKKCNVCEITTIMFLPITRKFGYKVYKKEHLRKFDGRNNSDFCFKINFYIRGEKKINCFDETCIIPRR